jgi:hypothetical protein
MAWTAPKTWTVGEVVTAANVNIHLRDNLLAAGPHLVVRKTADESVTSSVTFQDDDVLLFAVAANEIWQFEFVLITTGTFDFAGRLAFPSGRIDGGAWYYSGTASALTNIASGTSPSLSWVARADSTSVPRTHHVIGTFANGGSAGNLTLQWAQGSSGATATIVKANSTLWAAKLA